MNNQSLPLISTLDIRAATTDGARFSNKVAGVAPYNAQLTCESPWSPMLFANGTRNSASFLSCQVIAYDIDNDKKNDALLVADAAALMRTKPYAYSITLTANHQRVKNAGTNSEQPARDRFRLVVFTHTAVTDAESYLATWKQIANDLGIYGAIDKSPKDIARYYAASSAVYEERLEGARFPVTEVVPEEDADDAAADAPQAGLKGSPSRATLEFIANGAPNGQWHSSLFKAAIDLKEQGYDFDAACTMLTKASPESMLDEKDMHTIRDVYHKREGKLPLRIDWPKVKNVGTKSAPKFIPDPSALANVSYCLTELLGFKFAFNDRAKDIYYKQGDEIEFKQFDSIVESNIVVLVNNYGLNTNSILHVVNDLASKNKFDPLLDAISHLKWDGTPRIDALFDTLILKEGVEPEERAWYRLYLRKWIVGIIQKADDPGSENNVLVFLGDQGKGKSRWFDKFRCLWPAGYGEGQVDPSNKDHQFRHVDNFLHHAAELDTTTGAKDVGALKDYFTMRQVKVRRPYTKYPITARSVCSFCGTVNSPDFLRDLTGNRRYSIIPVDDIADHNIDIMQVYAEAKYLYSQGEVGWFNKEQVATINKINQRYVSLPRHIEQLKERVVAGSDPYTLGSIVDVVAGEERVTQAMKSQCRIILEQMGVKSKMRGNSIYYFIDGKRLHNTSIKRVTATDFDDADVIDLKK